MVHCISPEFSKVTTQGDAPTVTPLPEAAKRAPFSTMVSPESVARESTPPPVSLPRSVTVGGVIVSNPQA